jgi:hypothetical protein
MGYRKGGRIDNAFTNFLFGRDPVERGTRKLVKHVRKARVKRIQNRKRGR